VRELEHLVERSVLLTHGTTITTIDLPDTNGNEAAACLKDSRVKTIDEVEREHIVSVLQLCKGKVAGIGGAAEKLNIPCSTLSSKMRRLNIKKELYINHLSLPPFN
jgi:transcriptional regulator with GAF, ATPase, and Fis domain